MYYFACCWRPLFAAVWIFAAVVVVVSPKNTADTAVDDERTADDDVDHC